MDERQEIYDKLCYVLTDYEDGYVGEIELYNMLCTIQNKWEDVITASN